MPLSSHAPRRRVHKRSIECIAYEREDGLWDIEGHLTDMKNQRIVRPESGKVVEPGTATHDMWVRLTIDMSYKIRRVEAAMDACRFPICSDSMPYLQKIEGIVIGRGFNKAVQQAVGGVRGCTHMRELIGRMATTAHQAINRVLRQREGYNSENRGRQIVDTCSAYASDSPAVLERWPGLYTGRRS